MRVNEDLMVLQLISAELLEIPVESLSEELEKRKDGVKKLESFIDSEIDKDGDLIRCSFNIRTKLGLNENEIYRLLRRLKYI